MVKIVCWNIAHRHAAWRFLLECDADIALLQEAGPPPDDVAEQIEVDPAPFHDADGYKTSRVAIVKLSDQVQVEWLEPVPIPRGSMEVTSLRVNRAPLRPPHYLDTGRRRQTVRRRLDLCGIMTGSIDRMGKNHPVDAPLHRVISDLSLLIGHVTRHRIVAGGRPELSGMATETTTTGSGATTLSSIAWRPLGFPWSGHSILTDGRPILGRPGCLRTASERSHLPKDRGVPRRGERPA